LRDGGTRRPAAARGAAALVGSERGAMNRVMLAFTGGLQSSVCLHWLSDHEGYRVQAVFVDVGQRLPTWEVGEFAVRIGADRVHTEDCRAEFIRDYAFRALRASAVYERCYLLSSALARPLVAAVLVRLAREEGCMHVALGACSRSNDLARFQAYVAALDPELDIVGPDRVPPLESRQAALDYAREHQIMPPEGFGPSLSFDANLWGVCTALEPDIGTWDPAPEGFRQLSADPGQAPQEPDEFTIEFEHGTPVAIGGEALPPQELVRVANERAGRYGIGRVEVIEDRLTGMKAREVYDAPGATCLMEAHCALEGLTLDYWTLRAKEDLAHRYADVVYAGGWFSQLREALDAFVDATQRNVTGEVRVQLRPGLISILGRRSPFSLYDPDLLRHQEAAACPCRPAGENRPGATGFSVRTSPPPRTDGREAERS